MPRTEPPIFDPTPEQADRAVSDLADPLRTLLGIADEHKTSLEALTLWMQRPDVAKRLHALQSAFIERVRLIALGHLPHAVPVLVEVLGDYHEQMKTPRRPGYVDAPVARERRRAADGARKSIHLLTNLSRLAPPPEPQTRATDRGSERSVRLDEQQAEPPVPVPLKSIRPGIDFSASDVRPPCPPAVPSSPSPAPKRPRRLAEPLRIPLPQLAHPQPARFLFNPRPPALPPPDPPPISSPGPYPHLDVRRLRR